MDSFILQARSLANTTNEADRRQVLDTLRDVQYSLESPYDTLQRLSCVVSTSLVLELSPTHLFSNRQ